MCNELFGHHSTTGGVWPGRSATVKPKFPKVEILQDYFLEYKNNWWPSTKLQSGYHHTCTYSFIKTSARCLSEPYLKKKKKKDFLCKQTLKRSTTSHVNEPCKNGTMGNLADLTWLFVSAGARGEKKQCPHKSCASRSVCGPGACVSSKGVVSWSLQSS